MYCTRQAQHLFEPAALRHPHGVGGAWLCTAINTCVYFIGRHLMSTRTWQTEHGLEAAALHGSHGVGGAWLYTLYSILVFIFVGSCLLCTVPGRPSTVLKRLHDTAPMALEVQDIHRPSNIQLLVIRASMWLPTRQEWELVQLDSMHQPTTPRHSPSTCSTSTDMARQERSGEVRRGQMVDGPLVTCWGRGQITGYLFTF